MASQYKDIRLFKSGLDALIDACESRINTYKKQMQDAKSDDDYADLGNDCNVLCSVLELLKATNDEWNNEIKNDVNKYKEQQS